MRELRTFQTNSNPIPGMAWKHLYLFPACIMLTAVLSGCSHFSEGGQAKPAFQEASDYFRQGDYSASLRTYQHILDKYPTTGDRVLFEMGIIAAYPGNEQKDYQKSLQYYQKLINDYPESGYRKDSEIMVFTINNVMIKDKTIAAQHALIETLQQQIKDNGDETVALKNTIAALEDEVKRKDAQLVQQQKEAVAPPKGPADKILIEKSSRRMTLFSKGMVLKTYQIALGGNPIGPKERQGDNKTPEGNYVIDARNRNSSYHRSLHISYPNGKDKKRAQELGVPPGGDIMIHGIKNGYSWAGEKHAEIDWTKGCIAVTDEEIEEIDMLVPIGTTVEIRP